MGLRSSSTAVKMPENCSAHGCKSRRSTETKANGITFHKFPGEKKLRRKWELSLRRKGFVATKNSALCSKHFRPEDFDRTGQIVRLREGAIPNFSPLKLVKLRNTKTSRKAEEKLPVKIHQPVPKTKPPTNDDHCYALPNCSIHLKAKLRDALARVETLEQEKLNAKAREGRAKKTIRGLLEDLKRKTRTNKELKERLDSYSQFRMDLFSKQGHEYTKEQKEFAHTLYLHSPKAYSYIREFLQLPLPHPHTLQRWTHVNSKLGPTTETTDSTENPAEEEPAEERGECESVTFMLDATAVPSLSIEELVQDDDCSQEQLTDCVVVGDNLVETFVNALVEAFDKEHS